VFASLQLPKVNRKGLIPAPVTIDKKKPLVTVHIILHDGEFLQQQFNEEHTIYAIIDFINRYQLFTVLAYMKINWTKI
jgi:hypothetical protein